MVLASLGHDTASSPPSPWADWRPSCPRSRCRLSAPDGAGAEWIGWHCSVTGRCSRRHHPRRAPGPRACLSRARSRSDADVAVRGALGRAAGRRPPCAGRRLLGARCRSACSWRLRALLPRRHGDARVAAAPRARAVPPLASSTRHPLGASLGGPLFPRCRAWRSRRPASAAGARGGLAPAARARLPLFGRHRLVPIRALLFGRSSPAPPLCLLILGALPLFWVNVAKPRAHRRRPRVAALSASTRDQRARQRRRQRARFRHWGAAGSAVATVVCVLTLSWSCACCAGAFG